MLGGDSEAKAGLPPGDRGKADGGNKKTGPA